MQLLEQIQMEDFLSGKESFRNFLFIVNKLDLKFRKKGYLNTGDYYFFYYSDSIPDNKILLDELKLKKSLKASYLTLKKIKRKTLSFYIGVKDFIFEYGFYDVSNMIVYKTGKFKVTSKYFKNLPRHKCFKNIRSSLRGANLTSMKILHKIKEDLKDMWPDSDGVIKVVEDQKVRKSFSKKLFSLGSLDENKLAKSAEKFSQKYKWSKYIFNYVVIGKKMVHFYFAIQNKSVLKIDINI
jgi:hypothetical protein